MIPGPCYQTMLRITFDAWRPDWAFEVDTSPHDSVKVGVLSTRHSRVMVSGRHYRTYPAAYDVAACLAVAVHGGMPTRVVWV